MQITVDIPDVVAEELFAEGQEPSRAALETLLVEAYRTWRVSETQVKRALGYSTRMEVHQLMASRDVPLQYNEEMLRQDIEVSDRLAAERARSKAA